MEFQFGVDRWYRWMAAPLGLGRERALIRISPTHLHVKLGWAFEADIPLTSIADIRRGERVIDGWGARGRQGIWVVNGSADDIVEVAIDPPVQAPRPGVASNCACYESACFDPIGSSSHYARDGSR